MTYRIRILIAALLVTVFCMTSLALAAGNTANYRKYAGIMFDEEEYSDGIWHYYADVSASSFNEYIQHLRDQGCIVYANNEDNNIESYIVI